MRTFSEIARFTFKWTPFGLLNLAGALITAYSYFRNVPLIGLQVWGALFIFGLFLAPFFAYAEVARERDRVQALQDDREQIARIRDELAAMIPEGVRIRIAGSVPLKSAGLIKWSREADEWEEAAIAKAAEVSEADAQLIRTLMWVETLTPSGVTDKEQIRRYRNLNGTIGEVVSLIDRLGRVN